MKKICPNCERETNVEKNRDKEIINVRGESIEVDVEYFKCLECQEEFDDPKSDYDPIEVAYEKYRHSHNMLHPKEIKSFRKKMGLTQVEMAKLLGWGSVTLSRYETGALQDETHEKAFRMAMEPEGLIKLIEMTPNALNTEKKKNLLNELQERERGAFSLERYLEEKVGSYEPDILSGYKNLSLQKLFKAILFFCKGGIFKTKLNKLLYYADFIHFKEYAISITGARYVHDYYGPVPENFASYYASLIHNENAIDVKEEFFSDGYSGEKLHSTKDPDLSIFEDSEIEVLEMIKEHFHRFNSKKISDLSHEEKGYKETRRTEIISYDYAEQIQLVGRSV